MLICLISIYFLDQPEELTRAEENFFLHNSAYIQNVSPDSNISFDILDTRDRDA